MSSQPRKRPLFEADVLEQWIAKERAQKQAPRPLKGRMPRVTQMQSPRQRRALRQTKDPVRAIYGKEGQQNATPVRANREGLTREVGPNDRHNDRDYRTGKETTDRAPKQRPAKARRVQPAPIPLPRADTSVLDLEEWIAREGRV